MNAWSDSIGDENVLFAWDNVLLPEVWPLVDRFRCSAQSLPEVEAPDLSLFLVIAAWVIMRPGLRVVRGAAICDIERLLFLLASLTPKDILGSIFTVVIGVNG